MSAQAAFCCTVGILVVTLLAPGPPQAGSLDRSFGKAGLVQTDFSGARDTAFGVVVQPDGRIVAAGTDDGDRFALARYLETGKLDTTFGKNGKVTTDLGTSWAWAYAVALQPDGKILVAGVAGNDFGLARFEADGRLDRSFGSEGWVLTDFGGQGDYGYDVFVQVDGKIVVAGPVWISDATNHDFGLARYRPDGSLDAGFGTGGKVATDISGATDWAYDAALQPDGKIVVVGSAGTYQAFDFAVVRYLAAGKLDSSFGTGGKVTTDFRGGSDVAYGVAILSDGRIAVGGYAEPANAEDFALACYLSDGSLDESFGVKGRVLTDFGLRDQIRALIVLANDRLVAAGLAGPKPGLDFALASYLSDGSLDPDFGTGGLVTTDVGGEFDGAHAVALQPDGKVVAAGTVSDFDTADFALTRYGGGSQSPKELTLLKAKVDKLVKEAKVSEGLGNSLEKKLHAADLQFSLGKTDTAKLQVHAFVLEVKAQKGKEHGIPAPDADELIETAEVILGK
ncbi:MAG: delta-60 repeat domain-containing protein [Planctomycetota bacterium]|jgi:uncharacterized delta-60 repeat protein